MQRLLLRSKLHRVRVTEADTNYTGSLTIDEDIMKKAGIAQWEKLLVANIENGARLETYAIAGPPRSRTICLNGAAARLGTVGDRLIVMVFGIYDSDETANPKMLIFDDDNNLVETIEGEQ